MSRGDAVVAPDAAALAELGTPPGLCADCRHLVLARSRRSVFVRCGLAASDPRFPRYPRLPVVRCAGFSPREAAGGAPRDPHPEEDR